MEGSSFCRNLIFFVLRILIYQRYVLKYVKYFFAIAVKQLQVLDSDY